MKDTRYTELWVDTLTARVKRELDMNEERSPTNTGADTEPVLPSSPTPPAPIERNPSPSSTPELLNDSLTTIHQIRHASTLVLFTPVLIPPNAPKTPGIDPFEPLGRTLSRHHRRVRHVPYLPSVGFTATHASFLANAEAALTLVCEPAWSDRPAWANACMQVAFTREVASHMGGVEWGRENEEVRTASALFVGAMAEREGAGAALGVAVGEWWPSTSVREIEQLIYEVGSG